MTLTETHFIFEKSDKYPLKRWKIVIPLRNVVTDKFAVEERSRRKQISGGSIAVGGGVGFGTGFIEESGKEHRLVIAYRDEYGIFQAPRFGVASFGGKKIREWAKMLYEAIAIQSLYSKAEEVVRNRAQKEKSAHSESLAHSNIEPLQVLKLRLAKGEITAQEYEELRKLLES